MKNGNYGLELLRETLKARGVMKAMESEKKKRNRHAPKRKPYVGAIMLLDPETPVCILNKTSMGEWRFMNMVTLEKGTIKEGCLTWPAHPNALPDGDKPYGGEPRG